MTCPKCGGGRVFCVDSRSQDIGVKRRRECRGCNHRFYTVEIPEDQYMAMRSKEDLLQAFLYRAAQVAAEIEKSIT